MQDGEVFFRVLQLIRREDVAVLQAQVFLLAEKALPLDAGHIQDVQLSDDAFKIRGLDVRYVVFLQHVVFNIAGQLQLLRGYEHHIQPLVAGHGGNKGVDGAAEFQIAAEANGEVFKAALFPLDGQQVGQRLGGVVVAAVPGVDDRDGHVLRRHPGRALLEVPHGDDVREAFHGLGRVGHALALGHGAAAGVGKADDLAAQLQHGGFKAQPRAGRGLVKEGGELFAAAFFRVGVGVCDDVFRGADERVNVLAAQVEDVQQIFFHTFTQLSSVGLFRKARSRALSSGAMIPSWAAMPTTVSKSVRLTF